MVYFNTLFIYNQINLGDILQELIEIYNKKEDEIKNFIISTLEHSGELSNLDNYYKLYKNFPSMELFYLTDTNFIQTSNNIYKNKVVKTAKNKDRSYLISKLKKIDETFSISEPYISSATGNTCITIMKKENENYIFIDFKLTTLLSRLGFVELHESFERFIKLFYTIAGFSLMLFASLAVGYSFFALFKYLILNGFTLDTLFKPIVSLTLGLAIFDLAKTILEREVYYKGYGAKSEDSVVLSKFTIAIIIALSIEALMVVFKIALHNYKDMIYGLYLIIGVGIIVISLGIYNYLSNKK